MIKKEPENPRHISPLDAFPVSTLAGMFGRIAKAEGWSPGAGHHSVKVLASEAETICSSLLENGLPRNPASREMLRQLYSPELAPELIRSAVGGEWRQPADIQDALTLCFVFHPEAIIPEVGVITKLPGAVPRSAVDRVVFMGVNDDVNEEISKAVFSALGRGCHIEPRLWSLFRAHYHREADWYLSKLSIWEITKLPDLVAERALQMGKRSAKAVSELLPSVVDTSRLQDLPGLFAGLRFVRDTSRDRRLPRELVEALVLRVERDSGSHTSSEAWCRGSKVGEPRRTERQADTLLIKAVDRLLQWKECDDELRRSAWQPGYLSSLGTEKVWDAKVIVGRVAQEKELLLEPIRRYCRLSLNLQKRGFNDTEAAALVASLDLLMDYEIGVLGPLLKLGANGFFAQISPSRLRGDKRSCSGFAPLYFASRIDPDNPEFGRVLQEALSNYREHPSALGKDAWSALFSAMTRSLPEDEGKVVATTCQTINGACVSGDFFRMCRALLDHKDLREKAAPWLERMSQNPDGAWARLVTHGWVSILPALRSSTDTPREVAPGSWTSDESTSTSLVRAMMEHGLLSSHVIEESPKEAGLQSQVCSLNLDLAACASVEKGVHSVAIALNTVVRNLFSEYHLADGVFENVKAALGRHRLTKRGLSRFNAVLSAHAKGVDGGHPGVRNLITTLNEIRRQFGRGRTVEELRQALDAAKLVRYAPRPIGDDLSTAVYLKRFGLSPQNVTHILFPALRLLTRGARGASMKDAIDPAYELPAESIDPDQLKQALDRMRKKVRAELTHGVLSTRSDLMRIPLQQRIASQRAFRVGGVLLAAGLSSYGVWYGYSREAGNQAVARAVSGSRGKLSFGGDSLTPNGSIPKREGAATVCTLSKPLPEDNSFLLTSILGSGKSATRPPLAKTSPESAELLASVMQARRSGDVRGGNVTMSFGDMPDGAALPISVGGAVEGGSRGQIVIDFDGVYICNGLGVSSMVDVSLPPAVALDEAMTIDRLQFRVGGERYSPLWTPSLSPDELKRLSPELWRSVEEARAMPVMKAIAHLQASVQNFMPYEAVPAYDSFRGSTADYIRAICAEKKGICGQYAELFGEVSAHAGIPSCIVAGLMASPGALEVTTADAHATNLVLLPAKDGRLVPLVIDATGVSSEASMPNPETVAERQSDVQARGEDEKALEKKRERMEEGLKVPTLELMTFIATAGIAGGVMQRRRVQKERRSPQLPKDPEKGESPSTAPAESSPVAVAQIAPEPERRGVAYRPVLEPVRVHSDWVRYYAEGGFGAGSQGVSSGSSTAIAGTSGAPREFWESFGDGELERYTKRIEEVSARFEPTSAESKMVLQKVPSAAALVAGTASKEAGYWSTRILSAWAQWVQDPSHAQEWLSRMADPERFSPAEQQGIIAAVAGLLPPEAQSEARRVLPRFFAWSQRLGLRRSPEVTLNCLLHAFSPPEEGASS